MFMCVCYHQQSLQLSEINLLALQDASQDHKSPLQHFLQAAGRLNQRHSTAQS